MVGVFFEVLAERKGAVEDSTTTGGICMRHSVLQGCVVIILLIPLGGCTRPTTEVQQGKVVTVGLDKLTMTDLAGQNEQSHNVASNVTVTCGDKPCGLSDIRAGSTVTVTTELAIA